MRRSLSNPGGAIALRGDREAADVLRVALEAEREDSRRLTHGFHSYPARMHPAIARICIAQLSQVRERVLDPFCGSGTVLIESMVAGRSATGVDLNPVATSVAQVQCQLRDETERARFVAAASEVSQASLARVRDRVPVRAPLSAAERASYEPHVLLELAGLHQQIAAIANDADRRALQVVFSSLVVKFSRQRADTSDQEVPKRIRKGLVSEFFQRKSGELAARWAHLANACGATACEPRLYLGDARELPRWLGNTADIDLILSSPPYGGTYDYHAHHARRYPWFGLDARDFERGEVGARRRLSRGLDGVQRWEAELHACLSSIAAVARPSGCVALLLGDAQVGSTRIDAGDQLIRLAERAGLRWIASAGRLRQEPRGGPPRREHLVLLQR